MAGSSTSWPFWLRHLRLGWVRRAAQLRRTCGKTKSGQHCTYCLLLWPPFFRGACKILLQAIHMVLLFWCESRKCLV